MCLLVTGINSGGSAGGVTAPLSLSSETLKWVINPDNADKPSAGGMLTLELADMEPKLHEAWDEWHCRRLVDMSLERIRRVRPPRAAIEPTCSELSAAYRLRSYARLKAALMELHRILDTYREEKD